MLRKNNFFKNIQSWEKHSRTVLSKTGTIFFIYLFLYQPTSAGTQVFCYAPQSFGTKLNWQYHSVINFHTKFTYSTAIFCIPAPCIHTNLFFFQTSEPTWNNDHGRKSRGLQRDNTSGAPLLCYTHPLTTSLSLLSIPFSSTSQAALGSSAQWTRTQISSQNNYSKTISTMSITHRNIPICISSSPLHRSAPK